jgi:hypothetical protein
MNAIAALYLSAASIMLGFICGFVVFWRIHQKLLSNAAALAALQEKLDASETALAMLQQTLAPVPILLQTLAPVLPAILNTLAPVPSILKDLQAKLPTAAPACNFPAP